MAVNDPVADFLTRIRNALSAQHDSVVIPASKFKVELARILKEQGYIEGYEILPRDAEFPYDRISVKLKYTEARVSVISGLNNYVSERVFQLRPDVFFTNVAAKRCSPSVSVSWVNHSSSTAFATISASAKPCCCPCVTTSS